jgi:hypothetical protein
MGIALMASVVVAMALAVMEAVASFFKACQMPQTYATRKWIFRERVHFS